LEAIKALRVGDLAAKDCMLMMWATFAMLPQAVEVMRAWGFRYVTGGTWGKRTVNGCRSFGTGYVLRCAAEPFLIGAMGNPAWASRSERNFLEADYLIEAETREHSRKPDTQYGLVERLVPNVRYAEIFGRQAWPDWDVWGNEADKFERAAE
jgi:N6-adenosine-specific RNA methylase IME4